MWLTSSERPRQRGRHLPPGPAQRAAHLPAPRHDDAVRRVPGRRFRVGLAAARHAAACRCSTASPASGATSTTGPPISMREWHRLFFINERRLRNFIAAGALDAGSDAIRLVGMPKTDCLVDGSLQRDAVLAAAVSTRRGRRVLYAPTWTPYSSLNAMGEEVVARSDRRRLHRAGEAARQLVRHGLRELRRHRLGRAARSAAAGRTWHARARRERVAVAGRGRRAGLGPQLGRVRVPAPGSPARAHRDARADPARRRFRRSTSR